MKFKKLGFSTREGLSIANFEDGWSMEWGQGGSYHCDLLFKGKVIAELTEEGNGGCLGIYRKADKALVKEAEDAILKCLKRCNENYGPDSKYDFCKNATEASDTEYASLVEDLLHEYNKRKDIAKSLKKGYTLVGVYETDYSYTIVSGSSESSIENYAKVNNIKGIPTFYDSNYKMLSII